MRSPSVLRRTTVVGAATLGLLAGSTLFAGGAGAELPAGAEFAFQGAAQSYVVPGNVCEVEIVAAGAQGGFNDARSEGGEADVSERMPGGLGGTATSRVTVTPGETLQVNVGGQGSAGTRESGGGAGGWNGGGAGGGLGEIVEVRVGGGAGGGGGASDVRQGGTALNNRVVIGGGGGGVGTYTTAEYAPFGVPGVGGNPATSGSDEMDATETYRPATGGGAATESAGGAAGIGGQVTGDGVVTMPDGNPGSLGQGGAGGIGDEESEDSTFGGGGGGGGLYGGGGGAIGYNMLDTAGGGGSSLGDTTQPGVQEGNGSVTITPTAECAQPTTTVPGSTVAPTTSVAVSGTGTAARPATPVSATPAYTG